MAPALATVLSFAAFRIRLASTRIGTRHSNMRGSWPRDGGGAVPLRQSGQMGEEPILGNVPNSPAALWRRR